MRYLIRPASDEAKKVRIHLMLPLVNQVPLPKKVKSDFPFKALGIGQSFFMLNEETAYYEKNLLKERIRRYNEKYAVYFHCIQHADKLEVTRLA